jgi:hypothetical protein
MLAVVHDDINPVAPSVDTSAWTRKAATLTEPHSLLVDRLGYGEGEGTLHS